MSNVLAVTDSNFETEVEQALTAGLEGLALAPAVKADRLVLPIIFHK